MASATLAYRCVVPTKALGLQLARFRRKLLQDISGMGSTAAMGYATPGQLAEPPHLKKGAIHRHPSRKT
jgi:hypothetical protein